jgi:hypothetical protein
MKKAAVILFVVGLLLETAAFLGDQASSISFILKFIAPNYIQAKKGLEKLETKNELIPQDIGFTQINQIFFDLLRPQVEPEVLEKISILKIRREGAILGFSTKRVKEIVPLKIELSNGQTVDWNWESLDTEVEKLKQQNIFKYATVIFVIGAIVQIVGF